MSSGPIDPSQPPRVGDKVWIWTPNGKDDAWSEGIVTGVTATRIFGSFVPKGSFSLDIDGYRKTWRYR